MNKLIFLIGFLLPIPAFFNDSVAGRVQALGGNLWNLFDNLGFIFYPLYLAIFIIPIFLFVAWAILKLNPTMQFKNIFLKLLGGFLISSCLFISFALIAISQFKLGF
jgi:hypothetical protein